MYDLVKEFYDFLINELQKIENELNHSFKDTYLLNEIHDFYYNFDFSKFYKNNFNFINLNETALNKFKTIIELMKKEYSYVGYYTKEDLPYIAENYDLNINELYGGYEKTYALYEKICWIEDALYILKKHIYNLHKNQK